MPTVSGPREWQRWIASIVIVIGWTIPSLVMGQANPAPGPAPAPTGPDQRPDSPWPSAIILDPPADRAALLGKLRRPDFLLWDGDRFDRWVNAREVRPGPARSGSGVVGSMAVQVHAEGGRARLLVEYRITTNQDEPSVIPVGLDGFLLGRVTEQGRDLPVASLGAGQGWGVGLAGRGEHVVEVETQGPIRSNPAGLTLEIIIPPAASTHVALIASLPLVDPRARPEEPLTLAVDSGGLRAEGHLGPRSRLVLTWTERAPDALVEPILAARGEVALTIADSVETRESWSIAAVRGTAREVVFRLGSTEEVADLQVNRRPVSPDRRGDDLVVPLDEPIASGGADPQPQPVTILLATKRPAPQPENPTQPARLTFEGHPIHGARSQTGVIGVGRSDAFLISPTETSRVRRVDPRGDRSSPFANRPERWLGFEFSEQPFRLGLEISPNLPRFEVNARTTVRFEGNQARVSTTIQGRVWQGRLFEVRVPVPAGLAYESGDRSTEGITVRLVPSRTIPGDPTVAPLVGSETLAATFNRSVGPGETFTLRVQGTGRAPTQGLAGLGLFGIADATLGSSEVALVSGRDHRVELVPQDSDRFVRLEATEAPAGWTWPTGMDATLGAVATWLRSDRVETGLTVRLTPCPLTVRHRSNVTVAIDRQGAEVIDELGGDVANGSVGSLIIALPPEVSDRWIAESGEGLEREPLDDEPESHWRRYRLKLAKSADAFQIRLRYRLEFRAGTDPSRDLRLQVQPVRLLDGQSAGQTVRISSEPDVAIVAEAPGWTARMANSRGAADSIQQVRRSFEHPGNSHPAPIVVTATPGRLADVPNLVASRLWLRSVQRPDGQLASTASYRLETHGRSIVIRLPAGSRWVRGRAGSVELGANHVEQVDPTTYQVTLPSIVGAGPIEFRVETVLDSELFEGSWPVPDLVGGVVQQTAWELSLLGARAGVGVPDGWTDENVWIREGLIWMRQPRRSESDLARWLADGQPLPLPGSPNLRLPGTLVGSPSEPISAQGWSGAFAGGPHSYLFSRPGPPSTIWFPTFARPTLLLVCSGPILVVGLLILARRPPPRLVVGGFLVLGFLFLIFVEPNTGFLIAQSSAVGVALAGIATSIQLVLHWRTRLASVVGAVTLHPSPSGASARPAVPGDSDQPTVIRPGAESVAETTTEFPRLGQSDATVRLVDPHRPESENP